MKVYAEDLIYGYISLQNASVTSWCKGAFAIRREDGTPSIYFYLIIFLWLDMALQVSEKGMKET